MSLLALDKWSRLFRIVSQNGGIVKSLLKLWRMDTLKEGKYMGRDCYGNRFFENKNYLLGRSRWVEYSPEVKWEYDASQITPEWYGWLHYRTDRIPCQDWAKYCLNNCCWSKAWLIPHLEIVSGTEMAYYPYSTTRPRFYLWDGHSICNRPCYQMQ